VKLKKTDANLFFHCTHCHNLFFFFKNIIKKFLKSYILTCTTLSSCNYSDRAGMVLRRTKVDRIFSPKTVRRSVLRNIFVRSKLSSKQATVRIRTTRNGDERTAARSRRRRTAARSTALWNRTEIAWLPDPRRGRRSSRSPRCCYWSGIVSIKWV